MTYWLCITNEANWKVIREKNIWGVPERHRNSIMKVKLGDKLVIYLKQERVDKNEVKEPRIVAVYEVVSEPFKDSTKIFSSKGLKRNETFPYRIKIKPIKIFDRPIEFKPLIPKLKFITNKKKWTGHLMGKAMRQIPEDDYELILKEI